MLLKKILKWRVTILLLSILILFSIIIFGNFSFFKKKAKLYLHQDIITFFKVITNYDGNLFAHYENDYKVRFLPYTQWTKVKFSKKKLDFIKRGQTGSYPFLIDFYKDNLFLTDTSGGIFTTKIKFILNGNIKKFKEIKTNLNQLIPENVMIDKPDLLIINEKIYFASGRTDDDCTSIELYSANLSEDFINFELIFSTKKKFDTCLSPKNNFGRIEHYYDGIDDNILLSIGHSGKDNDDTFGCIILINENKEYSEIYAKGFRGILGMYADENVILAVDNGPKGGDEINKVEKGNHYGFPYVSYGEKYTSKDYSKPTYDENHKLKGYTEPVHAFIYAHGTAEIMKLPNNFSSFWQDNFIISTLNGKHLLRIKFSEDYSKLLYNEKIYIGERVRDIKYHNDSKSLILALTSTGSIGLIQQNN